jgi:FkbM family methyltransferase
MNEIAADVWPRDRPWIGHVRPLLNGMAIEVDPLDMIGKHIIRSGCYEPDTMEFIRSYLRPGMVFLDVGAHVGQYTLVASGLVGSQGRAHAFEPHPLLYEALRRNVARNHCTNVVVNGTAVCASDGDSELVLATADNYGASSLAAGGADSGARSHVRSVTLDSYVRMEGMSRIDLIKIDIEGGELAALMGAGGVLRDHWDVALVVEICDRHARRFGYSVEDIEAHLRSQGFQLFRPLGGRLEPHPRAAGEPPSFNVVALRRPRAPRRFAV